VILAPGDDDVWVARTPPVQQLLGRVRTADDRNVVAACSCMLDDVLDER
jgi:hypothetical protein